MRCKTLTELQFPICWLFNLCKVDIDFFIIILRLAQTWCYNFSKILIGSWLTYSHIEEAFRHPSKNIVFGNSKSSSSKSEYFQTKTAGLLLDARTCRSTKRPE